MNALLEVQGVTKRFGGLNALDALSFEVAEGEIVSIIGPERRRASPRSST